MALTVKASIREIVKGYRISPEFFDALEKCVKELVTKAIERAKANGRKTLRAEDL